MASPTVQLATPADVPGIATVHLSAFNDEYFQSLFPPSGLGRAYHEKSFRQFIGWRAAGIQEARVWVVKGADGLVQSVALMWIVRPEDGGAWDFARRYPRVLPGMDGEAIQAFFDGMDAQHHAVMGTREHIYLELMMTHPAARRQGHATALLRHVSVLADEMDYPLYLDAEAAAVPLYERVGYEVVEGAERTSQMSPMIRRRRSEREA